MKERDITTTADLLCRHLDLKVDDSPHDLMSIRDPEKWFSTVFVSSGNEYTLVMGCVRAWRGGNTELDSATNDIMRFTFPALNERARVDSAFDMSQLMPFVVDIIFYSDDPAVIVKRHEPDVVHDCRKFIAIFDSKSCWERSLPIEKQIALQEPTFQTVVIDGTKRRKK